LNTKEVGAKSRNQQRRVGRRRASAIDRDGDDYPEPEPWSASSVLRLNAEFREALRIMRAVDGFNRWLLHASGERAKAAVLAALGPSSDRISTLLDLPIAERHCPSNTAPAP
jgi:hypothetical protein